MDPPSPQPAWPQAAAGFAFGQSRQPQRLVGHGKGCIGASEYIKGFADDILESEVCRMFEVCAGEVSVPFTPSCFWISSKKVVPGQEEQKME